MSCFVFSIALIAPMPFFMNDVLFHRCKEYRYDFRLLSHEPLARWATSIPATDMQVAWQDMHNCDMADIFLPSCLYLPAKLTESQFENRNSVACVNTVLRLCVTSLAQTQGHIPATGRKSYSSTTVATWCHVWKVPEDPVVWQMCVWLLSGLCKSSLKYAWIMKWNMITYFYHKYLWLWEK